MYPSSPQSPQRQLISPVPNGGVFSGPPYAHVPKSHKHLVRAIIILIILAILGGVGFWVYQTYLSKPSRALISANIYMGALTTDDVDLAAYMSDDSADYALLESASQAVKGEYKLTGKAEQNGAYYFLYSLTSDSSKSARATVVDTKKGLKVSTFIYSSGSLALLPDTQQPTIPGGVAAVIPSEEEAASAAATGVSTGTTGSTGSASGSSASGGSGGSSSGSSSGGSTKGNGSSSGASSGAIVANSCLAQSDYAAVFDDATADGQTWSKSNPYSVQISFNPGGTDYVDDFEVGDLYASWVRFYKSYPTKNYTFHVQGMTAVGNKSNASARAAKAAAALNQVGVPTSRIITDGTGTSSSDDTSFDDGYVKLSVVPGC